MNTTTTEASSRGYDLRALERLRREEQARRLARQADNAYAKHLDQIDADAFLQGFGQ